MEQIWSFGTNVQGADLEDIYCQTINNIDDKNAPVDFAT